MTDYNFLDILFDKLWPVHRSITGPGIRESYKIISDYIPLTIHKVSTGTKLTDHWVVPDEWKLDTAFIADLNGNKIIEYPRNPLCVLNFSTQINAIVTQDELLKRVYTCKQNPNATPYVTSYYKREWGFCLPEKLKKTLNHSHYHVSIKSSHDHGNLEYATSEIPGKSTRSVLLSSYLCHPQLANNELSGPLTLALLYNRIKRWSDRRYTYKFYLGPETIGSLCYLHQNYRVLRDKLSYGIVLTCLGGRKRTLTVKQCRNINYSINKYAYDYFNHVLPFDPTEGSDERQYCSPGYDLPVLQIHRDKYLEYPEYHNSMDTKDYMCISQVLDSVDQLEKFLMYLEEHKELENNSRMGEPMLSHYHMYSSINNFGEQDNIDDINLLGKSSQFLLSALDGTHDIDSVRKSYPYSDKLFFMTLKLLQKKDLIA